MSFEEPKNKESKTPKGLDMYFSADIAKAFAEHEQNEKNFRVAKIVDRILMQEFSEFNSPINAAELGGGAHPDRYDVFFTKLLQAPQGHIDWVDISPHMLKLAEEYISTDELKDRNKVIEFITSEILDYLESLGDEKLDLAVMKYTLGHIEDLDKLFKLLSQKLKVGGKLVSTVGSSNPQLKSFSTNARFFHNGEQFPDDETRTLKDGDTFTIKFFKVSGDPNSGYIEGAKTTKHYHSANKISTLAIKHGLEIFLGDWKGLVDVNNQDEETMDQEILLLTKK